MPTIQEIDQQIAELQRQKEAQLEKEKDAAMDKVMKAIQELNALGFHYELANRSTLTKPKQTRTRRPGVRDDVLKAIKDKPGIKPAEIAQVLDMEDEKGKVSINNALTALKKSGQVTAESGAYQLA